MHVAINVLKKIRVSIRLAIFWGGRWVLFWFLFQKTEPAFWQPYAQVQREYFFHLSLFN